MTQPSEELVAALVVLTRFGIEPDVQELLVSGNASRGIRPGALATALQTAADKARVEERERCAGIARNCFTDATVVTNKAGQPYLTGKAAIYAAQRIAAAITAEKETGNG